MMDRLTLVETPPPPPIPSASHSANEPQPPLAQPESSQPAPLGATNSQRPAGLPPPLLHFPPGYSPDSPAHAQQPSPLVPPRPLTWQDKLENHLSRVCSWVPFVFVCLIMMWSICAFVFHVGPLMDGFTPSPSFPFQTPSPPPNASPSPSPNPSPNPSPSPEELRAPAPAASAFTSERIAGTVVVGLLWILASWSYIKVVFTNPGSPKSVLSPQSSNSSNSSASPPNGLTVQEPHPSDATIVPIHDDDHVPLEMLTNRRNGVHVSDPPAQGQGGGDTEESVPLVPFMSSGDPALVPSISTKRNGAQRFCRKCDMPKPDRAHHCRICNQCVLKMDHHCPWVAGCVGFGNYKFFLLFLFYLSLYCFAIFCFTVSHFFPALATGPIDQFVTASNVLGLTLCSLLFGLTLFGFFCYHLSLVFANQTTIEAMETQRYDHSRIVGPKPPGADKVASATKCDNPFDLGWKRNFTQVFGPSRVWWMWLVPVASHQGDGVTYPVALIELAHHGDEEHVHQLV